MKTLDKVIKAVEETVSDVDRGVDIEGCYLGATETRDALHYLKELRDMTDIPMEYFENGGTSQELRNTSQITCPKCHSEFLILDDPDGDHQQLLKCQALLQDFYRNDPLDWDELKQMEGKPIYVKLLGAYESYPNASRWMLVQSDVSFGNVWFIDRSGARYCFYEKDMNDIWQAYRKER